MSPLTDRQVFGIAVILYGISAVYSIFLLRREKRHHNRLNYFLLLSALVAHTYAMVLSGFSLKACPINSLYGATTFISWTMVAAYLVIGLFHKLRFLGSYVAPLLFAIGVFALFTPRHVSQGTPNFTGGWGSLHIAAFTLAYAAWALSAVAGAMYLTQERDLKMHKLRAVLSLMPPIQRLETVTNRLLVGGFALFTVGLIVSVTFAHHGEFTMRGDFKVIWAGFVWLLYLGLILMRWKFWRGRRFAVSAIGACAFVLLTFWGSSLMSPSHDPRGSLVPDNTSPQAGQ
ncbi:MAG TPA: cytochrome c biogenesis protein CcsA [Candidatus Acidoferrum sp.]|nr:cytochrome c biogenesis protein CcsA [Candidatus Acidoferrum sp.]